MLFKNSHKTQKRTCKSTLSAHQSSIHFYQVIINLQSTGEDTEMEISEWDLEDSHEISIFFLSFGNFYFEAISNL